MCTPLHVQRSTETYELLYTKKLGINVKATYHEDFRTPICHYFQLNIIICKQLTPSIMIMRMTFHAVIYCIGVILMKIEYKIERKRKLQRNYPSSWWLYDLAANICVNITALNIYRCLYKFEMVIRRYIIYIKCRNTFTKNHYLLWWLWCYSKS